MLSKNILDYLAQHLGFDVASVAVRSVSGGDINNAYQLKTNQGSYFIKTNYASRFPGMFEKEAKGLEFLRSANAIRIPNVVIHGKVEDTSFLVLEWIDSNTPQPKFWESFGAQLANLHKTTAESYGLDHNNYIGSLHQSNKQRNSWVDFFIQERLQAQIKLAVDSGRMDNTTAASFDNLYKELPNLFPTEAPSLVHGDLWSGNFMVGDNGEPVIIDPAVYFGHREMDLAMTKLFGGYDSQLYKSYQEHYPIEQGWESRVAICNLYPLLVHVNLFGGGYLGQVQRIVGQF